jgi:hypothetical protein
VTQNQLERSQGHWHFFDIQTRSGARFGYLFESAQDRPDRLASLQGLLQYNKQAPTFSSNIRLAVLDRSGTGFFLVYNDRRDASSFTPDELLGRSFVVKYTRLFDY